MNKFNLLYFFDFFYYILFTYIQYIPVYIFLYYNIFIVLLNSYYFKNLKYI